MGIQFSVLSPVQILALTVVQMFLNVSKCCSPDGISLTILQFDMSIGSRHMPNSSGGERKSISPAMKCSGLWNTPSIKVIRGSGQDLAFYLALYLALTSQARLAISLGPAPALWISAVDTMLSIPALLHIQSRKRLHGRTSWWKQTIHFPY